MILPPKIADLKPLSHNMRKVKKSLFEVRLFTDTISDQLLASLLQML